MTFKYPSWRAYQKLDIQNFHRRFPDPHSMTFSDTHILDCIYYKDWRRNDNLDRL